MKIKLSQVKPSPNPIRKTWDKTKMDELRWSLMEEGQVEPIGVHESGTGYTIVWGHRRVEAARRAGWTEIEAVVVPQDEVDNLIQAGIENLAGEDMSTDDKAEWAQRLIDMGLSVAEISRRSTVSSGTIEKWLIYRREKLHGVFLETKKRTGDTDYRKVVEISRVLQDNIEAKKAVATKVSNDDLTTLQTRAIAEAYRDAPTPEVRQQVLKTPVFSRDTAGDILRRSIHRHEIDTGVKVQERREDQDKERHERRDMDAWGYAVKEFLDTTKIYRDLVQKGYSLIKYGKFSPEAARFTIRKIDALIDDLKTYREELESVK